MREQSLDERVDVLEKKMEALETLPARLARVEVQLAHLSDEIRAGDEETRRYIRVLHEDGIARLTVIQQVDVRARSGSPSTAFRTTPR